jgi:hypothetical protein
MKITGIFLWIKKKLKEGKMKKAVVIAAVFFLVFSAAVNAETTSAAPAVKYENCVYTNIYPWFILWANIAYERTLGSYVSAKVVYSNFSSMNSIGAEILFHPMGKGLDGFYLGPKFDSWITQDGSSMNWLGGIAGYGFLLENGVLLKLGVGYLFNIAGPVLKLGSFNFMDKWPAVDVGIGWAF